MVGKHYGDEDAGGGRPVHIDVTAISYATNYGGVSLEQQAYHETRAEKASRDSISHTVETKATSSHPITGSTRSKTVVRPGFLFEFGD